MTGLNKLLSLFPAVNLNALDKAELQNRADTKYIFSSDKLHDVLENLLTQYNILEVSGLRSHAYHTLYFDTNDALFYRHHHNGKANRYKIRYRKYIATGKCYLEIKHKTNKNRTEKTRKRKQEVKKVLSDKSRRFIEAVMPVGKNELNPALYNEFNRITLTDLSIPERVTIDYGLKFWNSTVSKTLNKLVIAEVKQNRATRKSHFIGLMHNFKIRPMSVSKYCIGSLMVGNVKKYNLFKPKLLAINKIEN